MPPAFDEQTRAPLIVRLVPDKIITLAV